MYFHMIYKYKYKKYKNGFSGVYIFEKKGQKIKFEK